MTACRYDATWGYLLRSHELNCRDNACQGCEPCMYDEAHNRTKHCTGTTRCTNHLDESHPLTCPSCVGLTRRDISEIVTYAELMLWQAIESGPRSEAAMLAGPAADPGAWRDARISLSLSMGVLLNDVEPGDPLHPLTVLGTWEMMLREDYGPVSRERITVASAASYLGGLLNRLAQDDEQDWPLFASEIKDCRTHLAEALHLARKPERGAPCSCPAAPSLRKVYSHHCAKLSLFGVPDAVADWITLLAGHGAVCNREHDLSGDSDFWKCPACETRYSEEAYRKWCARDYLDHAPALTASDISRTYGVPEGTVRYWANLPELHPRHVKKHGYDGSRRQLYDVADVKAAQATLRAQPTKEMA